MNERDHFSIALVGAGSMGGAMLTGWLDAGIKPERIRVIDPSPKEESLKRIKKSGVRHSVDFAQAPGSSDSAPDALILAVKPQIMDSVLGEAKRLAGKETTFVSVAAGARVQRIQNAIGEGESKVIRTMPNTPALIGRGMTVGFANENADGVAKERVRFLMEAIGSFEWVEDEALLDAVTAVSGSGPAYVFHLAECMENAAKNIGLPEKLAVRLARETIAGAGELMRQSQETARKLRENVTSPNGTTQAALDVLMQGKKMESLIESAIKAARKRSTEL